VEQEPYVFEGTIRENILFGAHFELSLYQRVIGASCLDKDIQLMPEGDLSKVGEKGLTLSGGQRARLSFARALY
jgi:ATP-binding cassette, subfamily C (CFTR/MRP), member 4